MNNTQITIAVITPGGKEDYLVRTVVDGLEQLRIDGIVKDVKYTSGNPRHFGISCHELNDDNFIKFARSADVILYCWGKVHDHKELVDIIGRYNITAYIDGSELGHNKRLEPQIVQKVEQGSYQEQGAINTDMLKRCVAYFRREKPYVKGVLPLPYGIERAYTKYSLDKNLKERSYDIISVFGQRKYPPLRELIASYVEMIKAQGSLRVWNTSTKLPFLSPNSFLSRWRFYKKLANARVGISISGGGFDTARFWEILGSGALLLTQKIDINFPDEIGLPQELYAEFSSGLDIDEKLKMLLVRANKVSQEDYRRAYSDLIKHHSSAARMRYVLRNVCERCGLGYTIE